MAKTTRSLILAAVLFLAACSFQNQTELPPTETALTFASQTTDTAAPAQASETAAPTSTPLPPTATPQPPQKSPTPIIVSGEPFPLVPPGSEIDIKVVELITADFGWGIAPDQESLYHIFRTDDGGQGWSEITPPQPIDEQTTWEVPAVEFNDPKNGWVAYTGSNLIWSTQDGGRTWKPAGLEFDTLLGGIIHSLDNDQVWFFQFVDGGMQKVYTVLYKSENGGDTWSKLLDPFTDADIQAFDKTGVDFHNAQYGWLTRFFRGVTPNIRLDLTVDGGQTWQSLELPPPTTGTNPFSTCACGLYDPHLESTQAGSFLLTCECEPFDDPLIKSYLYQTDDGGSSWTIEYIPEGDLHFISTGTYYVIGQEIYRSEDAGANWDFVKTVYWDGQLSFVDGQTALGIARCFSDDQTSLVKTTNGCQTFQLIEPRLLPNYTER